MASNDINFQILVVIIVLLFFWNLWNEWRIKKLTGGKNGQSLESIIAGAHQEIARLKETGKMTEAILHDMERRLKRSVQVVETVRFNAFKDSGGGQCFSSAFLNEYGDGVIISTIYSRDRVSVFSKQVKNFESPLQFSQEEAEAVKVAKSKL